MENKTYKIIIGVLLLYIHAETFFSTKGNIDTQKQIALYQAEISYNHKRIEDLENKVDSMEYDMNSCISSQVYYMARTVVMRISSIIK